MDTETVEQKIERLRKKSEIFLKENIKSFIRDIYKNYHFCYIKEINSNWLIIENFKGKRKGEKIRILFLDILDIQEYREEDK